MKPRKIKVTAEQLDQFMDDLRNLPTAPIGECLADEEYVSYAMGTLTPQELQQIDEHLDSCSDCVEQMVRFLEASGLSRKDTQESVCWNSEVVLEDIASDQVGAEIVISHEERMQFSSSSILYVDFVSADPESGHKMPASKRYRLPQDISLGLAAATDAYGKIDTEFGELRWLKESDDESSLTIRFGSHATLLRGIRLRLSVRKENE
jgi:hypothetical protein